ncbi:hypothetical protein C8R41DRAFT_921197 [Lentinula lateritia]|uniref:Uncharacterized protein n=1 Tax=Lentinula lateritia TaxID=40482 RepID=A0ABQ8VEG1_9AGAR|nr:hypothetical protein C8R41DRAFT_921197 [Lentinula lateritia]
MTTKGKKTTTGFKKQEEYELSRETIQNLITSQALKTGIQVPVDSAGWLDVVRKILTTAGEVVMNVPILLELYKGRNEHTSDECAAANPAPKSKPQTLAIQTHFQSSQIPEPTKEISKAVLPTSHLQAFDRSTVLTNSSPSKPAVNNDLEQPPINGISCTPIKPIAAQDKVTPISPLAQYNPFNSISSLFNKRQSKAGSNAESMPESYDQQAGM